MVWSLDFNQGIKTPTPNAPKGATLRVQGKIPRFKGFEFRVSDLGFILLLSFINAM